MGAGATARPTRRGCLEGKRLRLLNALLSCNIFQSRIREDSETNKTESVQLPVRLYLFIHPFIYLYVYLSVCLSIHCVIHRNVFTASQDRPSLGHSVEATKRLPQLLLTPR